MIYKYIGIQCRTAGTERRSAAIPAPAGIQSIYLFNIGILLRGEHALTQVGLQLLMGHVADVQIIQGVLAFGSQVTLEHGAGQQDHGVDDGSGNAVLLAQLAHQVAAHRHVLGGSPDRRGHHRRSSHTSR